MKAFIIILSFFSIICKMPLQAQDGISLENIQDSIFRQLELYPQEKIHLHIDRDMYVSGEKIWFKAYVTEAMAHLFPTFSNYVYVELINSSDSLITRVMVRKENELFHGYLLLSEMVQEGKYTIRAYTRYMENMGDDYFFRKNIQIGNISGEKENDKNKKQPRIMGDYEVSFFPEGGNLLEGTLCRIAFKALNKEGYSETVNGEIVDESGTKISDANTVYAGMGSFSIKPEKGKKYYLECRNSNGIKKRFNLPRAYENAYSIGIRWNDRIGKLYVSRNSAENSPDISHYLLIHCRGFLFYFSQWDKDKEYITINKEQIPSGVVQLLLLDKDMNPVSERLVFNKTEDQIRTVFSTDKKVYDKRELVSSKIQLSDSEGNFPGGNLSIAITDDKDISVDSLTTITSSLLLSSELRGYIETPAYYLQDNKEASSALDHLMMTHGWRRYNIPEVIKGRMEIPEKSMEVSKEMSGVVKGIALGLPVERAEVNMIASTKDVLQTETDERGVFLFTGLDFSDSIQVFVQSLNKKGRPNVELIVNNETFPKLNHIPYYSSELVDSEESKNEKYEFIKKAEQRAKYDENMRHVLLSEIVITAQRNEKKTEPRLRYWANLSSDITVRREEIEQRGLTNLSLVLNTIMGVRVGSSPHSPKVFIRGSEGPAIIVLDGIIMEDLSDIFYDVQNIESIDVFKGASASIFGFGSANGAISITTKRGGPQDKTFQMSNIKMLTHLGYQTPAEFYSPKYDTPEAKHLGNPDYRTTILWKPDIVIDDNGEAHFDFYTSDFASTYSVVIEGLLNDGQIIRRIEKIEVR